MIFNMPGHIDMIRNGVSDPHFQELPTFPKKLIPEVVIKTQTRRPKRGVYQIEAERKKPHKIGYAVQRKRGVKAEPDIRIIFDRIWHETYFLGFCISVEDAWAEGGYTPKEYEKVFQELNPKFKGRRRWAFKFHVIEVRI